MRECIFFPAKKWALPGVWMYSAMLLPWLKNFYRSKAMKMQKQWMEAIQEQEQTFSSTLKWLGLFALAVNERKCPLRQDSNRTY